MKLKVLGVLSWSSAVLAPFVVFGMPDDYDYWRLAIVAVLVAFSAGCEIARRRLKSK